MRANYAPLVVPNAGMNCTRRERRATSSTQIVFYEPLAHRAVFLPATSNRIAAGKEPHRRDQTGNAFVELGGDRCVDRRGVDRTGWSCHLGSSNRIVVAWS